MKKRKRKKKGNVERVKKKKKKKKEGKKERKGGKVVWRSNTSRKSEKERNREPLPLFPSLIANFYP